MTFEHDGFFYDVIIKKKNNKHLYIRVDDELKIIVTCPYLYTKKMISEIIDKNKIGIIKMIKVKQGRKEKNEGEANTFLGKALHISYEIVKKPFFDGENLIVSDDIMLDKWYKSIAKEVFKTYLDEAYYVFEEKIPYPKLKVRLMKTRWGVCNRRDNSVTLNLELIKKDKEYLNYVIVHELSHFVHFNHSKDFWSTVEKYCPDYKRVRKKLKE